MTAGELKFIGITIMVLMVLLIGAHGGWELVFLVGLGYFGVTVFAIACEVDYENHAIDRDSETQS